MIRRPCMFIYTDIMTRTILIIYLLASMVQSFENLIPSYTVDQSEISVSGISSGGAMAVQFQMAYSGSIKGVGSIAGVPYGCSGGNLLTALRSCMETPTGLSMSTLVSHAHQRNNSGLIDNLDNLQHSRVFIWAGKDDTVVKTEVSKKMEAFYAKFMDPVNIKAVYADAAQHTFPTENYGNPCGNLGKPYIGRCNYNGAYELLNFIHGNLKRPAATVPLKGNLIEFNQTEFIQLPPKRKRFLLYPDNLFTASLKQYAYMNKMMSNLLQSGVSTSNMLVDWWWNTFFPASSGHSASGLDTSGFVYVPSGCLNHSHTCKLHVAFHGCKMAKEVIGDVFAKHAGYNEVGELNNIIMLYPQTKADLVRNPNGCWDWWGYTGENYDTRNGVQMKAVKAMIDRIAGASS